MASGIFKDKAIRIIGVPMDLGADRRGVDMGPSAIRIAGLRRELQRIGYQVEDGGDIPVTSPEVMTEHQPKLKYLREITRCCSLLAEDVENTLHHRQIPVVLGGDHSIAIGTISGTISYYQKQKKSCGVIWFDAHGDINTPETSPSGNIHGMPVAILLGMLDNIQAFDHFSTIDPKRMVQIGIRSLDEDEKKNVKKSGIRVYTMEEIDRRGMREIIREAIRIAGQKDRNIHVSFDVDCLDPYLAPGTGTPARGGLTYREAHTALEFLAESGMVRSAEFVELNPIVDYMNQTGEVAVELIASCFGKHII